MKEVWIVEMGDYSDYRVVGIFSTKANAERMAAFINGDATVDRRELDPGITELNAGHSQWLVWMLRDGRVEKVESYETSGYDLAGSVELWRRSKAPAYFGKDVADCITAKVWAKDQEHAVKIVNEIRAQWIATGKWKP